MKIETDMIKVWDPLVRVGHWLLVAAFFTAWFTEDDFLTQHVWAGYVVAVVIAVRIAWGFVGTPSARFRNFVRSPAAALGYLRDMLKGRARRYSGHNPAGAAMIVVLLLMITATGVSGLFIYAIEEQSGPLAAWVAPAGKTSSAEHREDPREEFWEEFHEIAANLTLLLVAAHIAGVLWSSYAHRENLVRAMITGRKRAPDAGYREGPASRRITGLNDN